MSKEYIKSRMDPQLDYYDKNARINKRYYYWTKSVIITFSASIPVIGSIGLYDASKNIIMSVLGALIAILTGLSGVMKFQEQWRIYRSASETLLHEKNFFENKSGPYNNKAEDEASKILVERVENILSQEHSSWIQFFSKQS